MMAKMREREEREKRESCQAVLQHLIERWERAIPLTNDFDNKILDLQAARDHAASLKHRQDMCNPSDLIAENKDQQNRLRAEEDSLLKLNGQKLEKQQHLHQLMTPNNWQSGQAPLRNRPGSFN